MGNSSPIMNRIPIAAGIAIWRSLDVLLLMPRYSDDNAHSPFIGKGRHLQGQTRRSIYFEMPYESIIALVGKNTTNDSDQDDFDDY